MKKFILILVVALTMTPTLAYIGGGLLHLWDFHAKPAGAERPFREKPEKATMYTAEEKASHGWGR